MRIYSLHDKPAAALRGKADGGGDPGNVAGVRVLVHVLVHVETDLRAARSDDSDSCGIEEAVL